MKKETHDQLQLKYGEVVDELFHEKEQLFERLYSEAEPSPATIKLSDRLQKKTARLEEKLSEEYDGVSKAHSVSFAEIAMDPGLILPDHTYKFENINGQIQEARFTPRFKKELMRLLSTPAERMRVVEALQMGFRVHGDGLKKLMSGGGNWFELRLLGHSHGGMRGIGCFGTNKKLILVALITSHDAANPTAGLHCPE